MKHRVRAQVQRIRPSAAMDITLPADDYDTHGDSIVDRVSGNMLGWEYELWEAMMTIGERNGNA